MTDERWRGEIEARVRVLEQEMVKMREFKHDANNQFMGMSVLQDKADEIVSLLKHPPREHAHADGTGENRHITMRDVLIVIATASAAWTAAWFVRGLQ